jgi:hypothetical protein
MRRVGETPKPPEGDLQGHSPRFSEILYLIRVFESTEQGLTSNYVPNLRCTRLLRRRGTAHSPRFSKSIFLIGVFESGE